MMATLVQESKLVHCVFCGFAGESALALTFATSRAIWSLDIPSKTPGGEVLKPAGDARRRIGRFL